MILLAQVANAQLVDPTFFIRLSIAPSIVDEEDPYPTFFVYVTDNRGSPIIASEDLVISLISSDTSVASVKSNVIIPKGEYYATGKVETASVGTTEIKASYEGQRVSSEITVVEISSAVEDFSLSVRLPATSMLTGTSMPFSVFLSDSEGNAVRAPFNIPIQVQYDQNLIKLDLPNQIDAGSVYAIGTISSLQKSGNAWIRLDAAGIEQQIATSVKVIADKPKSLLLKALPGNVTASDRSFYLYAGLLDETGAPAKAEDDINVRIFTNMTTSIVRNEILNESIGLRIWKGDFGALKSIPMDVLDPSTQAVFSFSAAAEGLQPTQTYLNLTLAQTGSASSLRPRIETIPTAGEDSKLIASIQLVDSSGALYSPPPGVIEAAAISSNLDALQVVKVGFFGARHSYALIDLKTGFKSDSSVVLVGAVPGFGSGNTTLSVVTKQPSKTTIFNPVDDVRFTNNRSDLYVVLLDDSDRVVKAEKNIQFLLTPINEIQSIASGQSYAHFDFARKQLSQTGNLTMVALPVGVDSDVDLESSLIADVIEESAATVQLIPAFRDIVSLKSRQDIMLVQLLDSIGNPYRAITDVSVSLASSDSDIIDVDQQVKIPEGSSYVLFPLYVGGIEGTARIMASASDFASSSISMKSVLVPLPLSMTPSLTSPETNRELKLTVNSEPGAKLTWGLPANVKVVKMDEQVAVDGTAELIVIPITPEDVMVNVEGTKAGYILNKVTYTSNVESVIQNLDIQMIPYTDKIVPGTVSTVDVKVTDDRGMSVEGVGLEWTVTNAEVLSMSPTTNKDGIGSVELMTQDKNNVIISVAAAKSGFSDVTGNISIAVESPTADRGAPEIFQGVPEWYLYLGLVGGIAAIASMRLMSMKKLDFKSMLRSSQSQKQNTVDSKTNKV
jgi:hypothetical protein